MLGHESPDHFWQRDGDPGQAVAKGGQQPLGPVQPLLSPGVVGQTQEVERRDGISAGLSSVLVWTKHTTEERLKPKPQHFKLKVKKR